MARRGNVRFYVPVIVEVEVDVEPGDGDEDTLAQAIMKAPNFYPIVQEMQVSPSIKIWFASEYESAIVRRDPDDDGADYEQRGIGNWLRK